MARVQSARRWSTVQGFDPLRPLFRAFTSVRVAIMLVLVVCVAALLGVIFPQAPDNIRLNPPAFDAWMETQRGRYGVFAEPMRAIDLFEVYHSAWFAMLLVVLLAAVAVCTANRIPPTWRMVRRPQRTVNDRYFERAHARAATEGPVALATVEALLRRKRYKVERVAERDGAVYLFADRHAWAALATFATHLSLILFMAGGIVSKLVGFQTFIDVAEGRTAAVFPVVHPRQMQVENLDSYEGIDADGNIVDYYTDLVVYRDGAELCRGRTTVNDPLDCAGYRFHQAAYTGDGIGLRVRDAAGGALLYAEAPILSRNPAAPSPRFVVRDAAGTVLFDDFLVLAPIDDRKSIEWVPLAGVKKAVLATVYRSTDAEPWKISVIHLRDRNNPAGRGFELTLRQGETQQVEGLEFSFPEMRGLPAAIIQGIPGAGPVALLQVAHGPDGVPLLDVQNLAGRDAATARFTLRPGEPVVVGGYEYTFEGPREYTGVLVKRDPGSWLIWAATALLIGGLAVTFYVPRRRLWLKVTLERTYAAGIAERNAHLATELRALLADAEQRPSAELAPPGHPDAKP